MYVPTLAEITITSEFLISEKSVPITDIGEFSGIAFEMSRACPNASSLYALTRCKSSREVDAARKAIAEPTLPLPIIEISQSNSASTLLGSLIRIRI